MKTYKKLKHTDQITGTEIEYIEITEIVTKVTTISVSELNNKKIEVENMLKTKLEGE